MKTQEQKLKKSQWYYECDCGFRIGHTVAQVSISEEIMQELFSTGKTKEKITGFISKAGNPFDTCLKYEDEKIQFDFDNPGETPAHDMEQKTQPWLEAETIQQPQNEQTDSENIESVKAESESDGYWEALMAGASDENAMNEEMDSMILSEQMLADDLPWN